MKKAKKGYTKKGITITSTSWRWRLLLATLLCGILSIVTSPQLHAQMNPNYLMVDDFANTLAEENSMYYWTGGGEPDGQAQGGLAEDEDVASPGPNPPSPTCHKITYVDDLYQWWATALWDGLHPDTKTKLIRYTHLVFEVKGDPNSPSGDGDPYDKDFYVGLQQTNKKKFDQQLQASDFTSGGAISDDEWRTVRIPLNKFITGVNLNVIQAIDFMFYVNTSLSGTIYFTNLRFEGAAIDDFEDAVPGDNLLRHPSSTGFGGGITTSIDEPDTLEPGNKCHKITWDEALCDIDGPDNIPDNGDDIPGYWYSNTYFPWWDTREPTSTELYTTLNMRVRGANGGETFRIEFQEDIYQGGINKVSIPIPNPDIPGFAVTTDWQELSIPLSLFVAAGVTNKDNMTALQLLFGTDAMAGEETIYIDDIYLSYVNQPPQVTEDDIKTFYLKKKGSFYIKATDPEEDHLTYSINNGPADAVLDPKNGLMAWQPDNMGTHYQIELTANDGFLTDTKVVDFDIIFPPQDKLQSLGLVRTDTVSKNLLLNGKEFKIEGIGYNPVPIGEDPSAPGSTWEITQEIVDRDLPIPEPGFVGPIRELRANTLRTWNTVNQILMDAADDSSMKVCATFWVDPDQDFTDDTVGGVRETLISDFSDFVTWHKDHHALLMWVIGNEVDLHIFLNTAEQFIEEQLAAWYSLANEMAMQAYLIEGMNYHPVALSSGSSRHIGDINLGSDDASMNYIDIWGLNVYAGYTFAYPYFIEQSTWANNYFEDYTLSSDKSLWISEYGIDSFITTTYDSDGNPTGGYTDEATQATWAVNNTKQILGLLQTPLQGSEACVGGSLMAYSDEWWKAGDPNNIDLGGYSSEGIGNDIHPDDYSNEEYWGIFEIALDGGFPSEPWNIAATDDIRRKRDLGGTIYPFNELRDNCFNEAPVITTSLIDPGTPVNFYVGESNGFIVIASDPDGDQLKDNPPAIGFTIDPTPPVTSPTLLTETYYNALAWSMFAWAPDPGDDPGGSGTTYTVTFTVAEDDAKYEGVKSTDLVITVNVLAGSDNELPVAVVGEDFSIPVGSTVVFDGTASTDNVGIQVYQWDFDWTFGFEVSAVGPIVSTTYDTAGVYVVGLLVNDGANNGPVYDQLTLTVTPADATPPTIWQVGDKEIVAGVPLVFDVTANDANGDNVTLSAELLDDQGDWAPITDLSGASFTDYGWNGQTFRGEFVWTPVNPQAPSVYYIKFTATDFLLTDYEIITITVYADYLPPTIVIDESVTPAEGSVTGAYPRFKADVHDNALIKKTDLRLYKVDPPDAGEVSPPSPWIDDSYQPDFTVDYGPEEHDAIPTSTGFYRYVLLVEDTNNNQAPAVTRTFFADTQFPVISNVIPDQDNIMYISNRRQPFHADVSDADHGLNNAELWLYNYANPDGIQLLNEIFYGALTGAVDYTPDSPLSLGTHTYVLLVFDKGFNASAVSRTFRVIASGCFLAGTPILMSDGTTKPIDKLRVGDELLAFDENTKEMKPDSVKHVFVIPGEEEYLVINGQLKVTPHHAFYVTTYTPGVSVGDGRWLEAGQLKIGDTLLNSEGKSELIASIKHVKENVTVYNLEVNPYHTFIAGGVVVHNARFTRREGLVKMNR